MVILYPSYDINKLKKNIFMVILYPSYDMNKLKGSVNSGSPFSYSLIGTEVNFLQ